MKISYFHSLDQISNTLVGYGTPTSLETETSWRTFRNLHVKFALKQTGRVWWDARHHSNLVLGNKTVLRLCQLYKSSSNSLQPKNSYTYATRHTHPRQIWNIPGHSSQFLNSFFPRTINEWNKLTFDFVSCTNIGSFKCHLYHQLY